MTILCPLCDREMPENVFKLVTPDALRLSNGKESYTYELGCPHCLMSIFLVPTDGYAGAEKLEKLVTFDNTKGSKKREYG